MKRNSILSDFLTIIQRKTALFIKYRLRNLMENVIIIVSDEKVGSDMKYIVLLCDGMADIPNTALNNRTPMSVAKKPTMNRLAKYSQIGLVKTVPYGFPAGSDVATFQFWGMILLNITPGVLH